MSELMGELREFKDKLEKVTSDSIALNSDVCELNGEMDRLFHELSAANARAERYRVVLEKLAEGREDYDGYSELCREAEAALTGGAKE